MLLPLKGRVEAEKRGKRKRTAALNDFKVCRILVNIMKKGR